MKVPSSMIIDVRRENDFVRISLMCHDKIERGVILLDIDGACGVVQHIDDVIMDIINNGSTGGRMIKW